MLDLNMQHESWGRLGNTSGLPPRGKRLRLYSIVSTSLLWGHAQARPCSSLRAEEPEVSIGRVEESMLRIIVIVLSMYHYYKLNPVL